MQVLRFLSGSDAEIGVLQGKRIVNVRIALTRLAQINGRLGPFECLFEQAWSEPKVFLALGGLLRDFVTEAIERDDGAAVATESGLDAVRVLPFIANPEKVFGVGYNYKELCDREHHEHPPRAEIFAKMPSCVTGAYDDVNVTPAVNLVDFESELCVIIGRTARRVAAADALAYVGGYTVMDELSAKILPRPKVLGKTETLALKAVDEFGALGAVVITPDEIPDPSAMTMIARVNEEQRQRFSTSDMVHSVPALIEQVSSIITLRPGDMISTGTSVGCGIVDVPPRLLNEGDVVECAIVGYPGCRNTMRIPAQKMRRAPA